MLRNPRYFRIAMFAFGLGIALPTAATLFAGNASASGYLVAGGIDGGVSCTPGGSDDCPDA